jgi:murein tripeptide amidase MpaA
VLGLRLGTARALTTDMILMTGNVHARELGTAEFCLHFANSLCEAYAARDGLICGAKTFSFEQISSVVDGLNLIIVPCVNPDGREWVMQGRREGDHEKMLWRGNRRLDGGPDCYGVDLNRNQDFLWDYRRHFQNSTSVDTTDQPCSHSQTYRGQSPASEPEARNVAWLLDRFPYIYAYLDFHAAYGAIVHPWGNTFAQTTDPNQNFQNTAFDGARDPDDPSYREYLPPADLATFRRLGGAFASALAEVRGNEYRVAPSIELGRVEEFPPSGPGSFVYYRGTTGANDDYAYSRHFVDSEKAKVLAFTVEFGRPPGDDDLVDGFQPETALTLPMIVQDLIAGTLGFCVETRASVPSQARILLWAALAVLAALILLLIRSC